MGRRCYVLLRRHHDVPIKCRGDVPLRRLGDVPPKRRWVFHLRRTYDVVGTYRETSLRRLVAGWVGKAVGYNNKILISNIGMEISSNRNYYQIRIYRRKSTRSQLSVTQLEAHAATGVYSMMSSDKSIKDAETILPIGDQKMFTEKHNDEKLAIALLLVGTELLAYHFW